MDPKAEFERLLRQTQRVVRKAPRSDLDEVARQAEELCTQAETLALSGADPEPVGLLTEALTSLVLSARAAETGDDERAAERLEQAGLFTSAARQAADNG